MSNGPKRFYEFGQFRIDCEERVLLAAGRPVPLTPKAFDTLLTLVENSGRVLEKDELMKRVWPDTFVEEANLANNISLLRKVLGETARQQYIQTVPRRGYRFVASVRAAGEEPVDLLVEKRTLSQILIEEEHEDEPALKPAAQVKTAPALAEASQTAGEHAARAPRWVWAGLLLALAVGLAAGLLLGRSLWLRPVPQFHQITFRRGVVWATRFAPDGQTVLYSAAWDGKPSEVFTARADSRESRPLDLTNMSLLSVSKDGELALLLAPRFMDTPLRGTLARLPLTGGGAPREVLKDVQEADWSPDGKELAVVHWEGALCRLEYPIKTTLYEARPPEWISDVRVSPRGDRIAFLDHPSERFDDRGFAVVVDLAGKRVTSSRPYTSAYGLAWSPAGDEVRFTASEGGLNNALYALTLSGRERLLARVAGRLRLHDISPTGQALVTRDNARTGIIELPPGEQKERDLSWLDGSWLRDISADGRTLLFDEEAEGGGATAAVYVRRTDGSPATRLGDGHAIALSPDGNWALARQRFTDPPRLVLFPTGVGDQKEIKAGSIVFSEAGAWFPDSRRLLLVGSEPNHPARSYVYDIDSGQARPVTPEGVSGRLLSPDGRFILAGRGAAGRALYPVEGGDPQPVRGLDEQDIPLRWSADGRAVYVAQYGELSVKIFRVELADGRRELAREITNNDPSGLLGLLSANVSADGATYAYTYFRVLSDLFTVEGLQ